MPSIAFIDTEIDVKSKQILDIGCIMDDGDSLHDASLKSFLDFIKGADYLCGHNVLNHDVPAIERFAGHPLRRKVIDTLYLSPLLFPTRPYHPLVKDDKINPEGPNNPYSDAIKARDLFYDEINAFNQLHAKHQAVYSSLLGAKRVISVIWGGAFE